MSQLLMQLWRIRKKQQNATAKVETCFFMCFTAFLSSFFKHFKLIFRTS